MTHTTHAIRYVLAFCFFVANAHTTNIKAIPSNAAAILEAALYVLVFISVLKFNNSVSPAVASSIFFSPFFQIQINGRIS